MRRILLIEDDEFKARALLALVKENFPALETTHETSVQSGLRAIMSNAPDLVLLDMSIPNYEVRPGEPGGAQPFGGEELLGHIDRFDIEVPVVVVTQFDTFGLAPNIKTLQQVDEALKHDFPSVYMGYVYYHATITAWREQLIEKIGGLLNA